METRASGGASDLTQLRDEIDRLVDAGDGPTAALRLRELWLAAPDSPTAAFVCSRWRRLDAKQVVPSTFVTHRVALLRSFTVEPMCPLLEASAWHAGIRLQIHVGEFNAYVQELLDPGSALYRFEPQSVILALQSRDVSPALWAGSPGAEMADRQGTVREVVDRYRGWIEAFRRQTTAHLILHNLDRPDLPAEGVLDAQDPDGQTATVAEINRGLQELARSHRGVYVLDYDGLIARHGRRNWDDARKWHAVRLPVAAPHLVTLAREWMKFLHPITGKLAKVCVVDLDNTLWGGVVGEDGLKGIQISQQDYRGAPYWNLQRALLELHGRGILLAIASKNNPADVQEVFEGHDGMLLKDAHFAARQINWDDKALNLQRIAEELNVGVDSLAFVDDNPVERQRVREALPEVMVLDVPADPMQFATTVRESPVFQRLKLSEEDRNRSALYQAERQRQQLQQSTASVEDFLRSLGQEAEIAPVDTMTLGRAAQLTQKTNQFNLTTRRYTEQQIEELIRDRDWNVSTFRVKDRYADNGLVGVAITHVSDRVCEIDSFLMSCRVIGRGVETALLSVLVEQAASQGCRAMRGWFLPTRKNAPCKSFFADHGFALVEEEPSGSRWELDLEAGARVIAPEWVTVHQVSGSRKD
jgi:FkbH-like protein